MNTYYVILPISWSEQVYRVTKSISWSNVVGLFFGVISAVTVVEWLALRSKFCEGNPNLTGAGGQMAFNDSYPRFEMEPVVVGAPETILKSFGISLKLMLL